MSDNFTLTTPVVLIIFNRAETTAKVLEAIRQVRPQQLFVIADGAREDRPAEAEKCAETRRVIDGVDWDCEVFKDYAETNLGCGKRVYTGLDWVFSHVEEAIILEDDCIPDPSFFRFCQELLEKYRQDTRIFSISSQDFLFGQIERESSYYFSRFHHSWGWATWKRAWQYFDFEMTSWSQVKQKGILRSILTDKDAVTYWTRIFNRTYENNRDLWDYQWLFASWLQNGLHIVPSTNLVSNIGFGPEATNTFAKNSKYAEMPTSSVSFPLKHPEFFVKDAEADNFVQKTRYKLNRWRILKSDFKKLLAKNLGISIKYGKIQAVRR